MNIPAIKFKLTEQTIKNIEKSTKCSINELRTTPINEIKTLMLKRGAIKKPSKIKQWFTDKYKTIGEKLGILEKRYDFYTHID